MAVNPTAVWRIRPSGNNANGAGFDAGIAGAGTDYSQQDTAQASGTHGAGSATTTFTDSTANAFTAAMVGNCINISGQGYYFVTAYISASQVTVDRALGTFTGASWSLGGAWADYWTPSGASQANYAYNGPAVAGNTIYVLGKATRSLAAPDYQPPYFLRGVYPAPVGDTTNGVVTFAADPATPSVAGFGTKVILGACPYNACCSVFNNQLYIGFYFLLNDATAGACVSERVGPTYGTATFFRDCIFDQYGIKKQLVNFSAFYSSFGLISCEFFDSTGASGGTAPAIQCRSSYSGPNALIMLNCNVHNCNGPGVAVEGDYHIEGNIIANNHGHGIELTDVNGGTDNFQTMGFSHIIKNNTIDGNAADGVHFDDAYTLASMEMMINNIISNHTAGVGIHVAAGTTAVNDKLKKFVDYNTFYNNLSNYSGISGGAHDTVLSTTPYAASSTENYTLA